MRKPNSLGDLKALARQLNRTLKSTYALSTCNDPFLAESPARATRAAWFVEIYRSLGLGAGAHLRRIHYKMISQAAPVLMVNGVPYENTQMCWNMLIKAARDARYLGLIPPLQFDDRRNPEPEINFFAEQNTEALISCISGNVLLGELSAFYRPPQIRLPTLSLCPPKIHQPHYQLEIWCEKSTMNDIIMPLGRSYSINVVTGMGELSATSCERLIRRIEQNGCRPVRIFYLSDFDPSGLGMPVSVSRKIEFFIRDSVDVDIQVQHVALTADQCIELHLPRTPIKDTDSRADVWAAQHGEGATELDALEALHPGMLKRILIEQLDRFYDKDINGKIGDVSVDVRQELEEITEEVHGRYDLDVIDRLQEGIEEIGSFAKAGLDTLRNGIADREAALWPLFEKAETVIKEMSVELEDEAPDAADFDWPEPAEADEFEDPLFDSGRGYVEQIDRYREHKGKDDGVALKRRAGTIKKT